MFPESEDPINHYVCEEYVVVLSTKKIYIYYYERFIDYIGDYYQDIDLTFSESSGCIVRIKGKVFNLKFDYDMDSVSFQKYYLKYRE